MHSHTIALKSARQKSKALINAGAGGIAIAMILSALPAMAYDWTGTLLNDNANPGQCDVIKDTEGKIVVYGTEGSWGGGHTKEQVFDGNITVSDNFFDPPEAAARAGGCWAGIGFSRPKIVTAIRVNCRSGMRNRLHGCLVQGATNVDFTDAETIHVITDDDNFGQQRDLLIQQCVTYPLTGAFKAFSYFRILGPESYTTGTVPGTMCGNCTELEFYGYDAAELPPVAEAPAPGAVNVRHHGVINGKMNLEAWLGKASVFYEIECRDGEGDFVRRQCLLPTDGYQTFSEDFVSGSRTYRIRGVNPNGVGDWSTFDVRYGGRLEGTWIGPTGSWGTSGNDGSKALDGNVSSYYDASTDDAQANNAWVGLDFGEERLLTEIRYVRRRVNLDKGRILGGVFQVADTSDFANATTVGTIGREPTQQEAEAGTIFSLRLAEPVTTRYARYHAPDGDSGSMAEIEFGAPIVAVPQNLSADLVGGKTTLMWTKYGGSDARIDGVRLYRSPFGAGQWSPIATLSADATSYVDEFYRKANAYEYALAYVSLAADLEGDRCEAVLTGTFRQLERDSSDKTKLRANVQIIYSGYPYQNRDSAHPRVAFDGSTETCCDLADSTSWSSGKGVAFGVDLGRPFVVTSARACSRNDSNANNWGRLTGVVVCGSNDGENWSTNYEIISEAFTANGQMQWSEVAGTSAKPYRYVFVRNPDANANFWGNISELELYGYNPEVRVGLVIYIY